MTKKLRWKFLSVFMAIMIMLAIALSCVVYFHRKNTLEYDCMVYMLNINNFGNKTGDDESILADYPPFFVLEIDQFTDQAQVVLGEYFLDVPMHELLQNMIGRMDETGIIEEYGIQYYNGVREANSHRIVFMDITYIEEDLHNTLNQIIVFALSCLVVLFFVGMLLSYWFARPAKQALDEQNRFVAFASHELKTPLSIIMANMELLEQGEGQDDFDPEFCYENMRQESDRMLSLIEAMIWLALPERGGEKSEIDMTKLLREEALRFEVRAFESGVTLESDIQEGLSVYGDKVQLSTLVDVLLDNAVKYSYCDGNIQFTAKRPTGLSRWKMQICVANTGDEIPMKDREEIFKPFYQTDSGKQGAGIGLSIAHEIVTAIHGQIRVESKDGYTRFIIDL